MALNSIVTVVLAMNNTVVVVVVLNSAVVLVDLPGVRTPGRKVLWVCR